MAVIEERQLKQTMADGSVKTRRRYKATISLRGFRRTSKTFDRKTDAQAWAQKTEYEMRHQLNFGSVDARSRKVSEAIDRYLTNLELENPRRANEVRPMLVWWRACIGSLRMDELAPDLLLGYRERIQHLKVRGNARLGNVSNAWVNRKVAALSRVLAVAETEWRWINRNPLAGIRNLPEPAGRTRFLHDGEFQRLWIACNQSSNHALKTIVALAVMTGMRRSEIANMKVGDLNAEKGTIILLKTKNKRPRLVKVVEPVLGMLVKLQVDAAEGQQYLFPSPTNARRPNDFRSSWETARTKAGLSELHFHDLRHSAASFLAMNGAALHDIAEVLGHSSVQVTKRYVHLLEKHTTALIETTAKKVFANVSPQLENS